MIFSEIDFFLANSADPDKMSLMWHFIRVFIACESSRLGVSGLKRVKGSHVEISKKLLLDFLSLYFVLILDAHLLNPE